MTFQNFSRPLVGNLHEMIQHFNRPHSIYKNSAWQWGLEDTKKETWMTMFIHFFCLCLLSLTIKVNFNISKVAYWGFHWFIWVVDWNESFKRPRRGQRRYIKRRTPSIYIALMTFFRLKQEQLFIMHVALFSEELITDT